jgi:hypothetical protein
VVDEALADGDRRQQRDSHEREDERAAVVHAHRQPSHASSPSRIAWATIAARSATPSLRYARRRCVLTVGGPIPGCAAICGVSFKKSRAIVRVKDPAGVSIPCGNVRGMGNASDGRSAFSLAWVGTRLFEADNKGLGAISDARQCAVTVGTCNAVPFLTGQITAPQTIAADQQNSTLYVGAATNVYAVQVGATQGFAVYQSGFGFVTGLTVDPSPLGAGNLPVVSVGDDPPQGALPGAGRIGSITP